MQQKQIIDWESWLQHGPGQYLLGREQSCLDHSVSDIFGYQAVQLGCPLLPALRENRIPHQILAHDKGENDDSSETLQNPHHLRCRFDELPFDSQSIDLAVLPHTLEQAENPHQVLREIERILVPEGKVIVTGINPVSLWGMRQGLLQPLGSPYLPHAQQWLQLARLKDWLTLLDLEILTVQHGGYAFPTQNLAWLENSQFMEKMGQRWWPILGAFYTVTAIKRVRGMRLIGPAWRTKRALRGLAPSTHTQSTTHPASSTTTKHYDNP